MRSAPDKGSTFTLYLPQLIWASASNLDMRDGQFSQAHCPRRWELRAFRRSRGGCKFLDPAECGLEGLRVSSAWL